MDGNTSKSSYTYRGQRALELSAIGVFLGMISWVGIRVAEGIRDGIDLLGVAVSVLTGYVTADFISGVVHWAGDTLGTGRTPVLGRMFIQPFRMHHVDPREITRHDFVETNGNSSIISAPVLLLLAFTPETPGPGFFAATWLASAALFLFVTNQLHKWAHALAVPRPVQLLQWAGLILSPEHHAIHHAHPHDTYYCITVGWLNPLLARLRFFRVCEAVVAYVRPSFLHIAGRSQPPRTAWATEAGPNHAATRESA